MESPVRKTQIVSGAVNLKERGVQVARIRKLSVGTVDIVDKSVGVIDLEGLIHNGLLQASPPVAGLLGAEILNRHHGIIDFGTRTLYVKRYRPPVWYRGRPFAKIPNPKTVNSRA